MRKERRSSQFERVGGGAEAQTPGLLVSPSPPWALRTHLPSPVPPGQGVHPFLPWGRLAALCFAHELSSRGAGLPSWAMRLVGGFSSASREGLRTLSSVGSTIPAAVVVSFQVNFS